MKKIVMLVMVMLLTFDLIFYGCIENSGAEEKNVTHVIALGDTVEVDYILRTKDSKIIDTTIENIGFSNNISKQSWQPVTITIQEKSGFIKGFTYSLMGHSKGEHFNITVPPELAYGQKDQELIAVNKRNYNFSLYQNLSKSYAESVNRTFEINLTFKDKYWNITVVNETDDNWILFHHVKVNQTFINGGVEQRIYKIENDTAFVTIEVKKGEIYLLNNPKTQQMSWAVIADINETNVVFDWNHKLAGETLYFEIWIRDVK